jgi:hypothetical protein
VTDCDERGYPDALTGNSETGRQDAEESDEGTTVRRLATPCSGMNNDNVSTATTTPGNPMTMNKHL